ncbi:hypothetical protein J3458_008813 [Metarhizium acridum]|uniref:uncharacterized protein n=1 Tax=Metarhizium acridum TaxID=92637 RepID=UPI001C6B4FFC|nr:hypothetical protein J3458_008813 [Metarhizium acridum]
MAQNTTMIWSGDVLCRWARGTSVRVVVNIKRPVFFFLLLFTLDRLGWTELQVHARVNPEFHQEYVTRENAYHPGRVIYTLVSRQHVVNCGGHPSAATTVDSPRKQR